MNNRRNHHNRRIVAAIYNTVWAITVEQFQQIVGLLEIHHSGESLTKERVRDYIGTEEQPPLVEYITQDPRHERISAVLGRGGSAGTQKADGQVVVINLFGIISQRPNIFQKFFGGTSTEELSDIFRQLVKDESVSAIILNVDSPGGTVGGIAEMSDLIFQSRGQKPIVAVANPVIASATYWIAASADEIVATPSTIDIGSIGVLQVHQENSKAHEKIGSAFTVIKSAKFKAEGNPFEKLSKAAREHFQNRIDTVHENFVSAVARGRGVTPAVVNDRFGEGRSFLAAEAVQRGLADRIATLEDVLGEFGVGPNAGNNHGRMDARHRPVVASVSIPDPNDPRFQPINSLINT